MEVLGYWPGHLAADASWLLDHLVDVASPQPGDIVGYGRAATGAERKTRDVVWHVMIYARGGDVIGACDVVGEVTVRPMEYEPSLGARKWNLVEPPPFRALIVR